MDPVALTVAVLGITAHCVRVAQGLQGLRDKVKGAKDTLNSLCAECALLEESIKQLSLRADNDNGYPNRPPTTKNENLERLLQRCTETLNALEKEISSATGNPKFKSVRERLKLVAVSKLVWNEEKMLKRLVELRGLKSSLAVYIAVKSDVKLEQILAEFRDLRDKVAHLPPETSPRAALPASLTAPESESQASSKKLSPKSEQGTRTALLDDSIEDKPAAGISALKLDKDVARSIISGYDSALSDTQFSFDEIIINSDVYRRAFYLALKNSPEEVTQEYQHHPSSVVDKSEDNRSLPPNALNVINELDMANYADFDVDDIDQDAVPCLHWTALKHILEDKWHVPLPSEIGGAVDQTHSITEDGFISIGLDFGLHDTGILRS